MFYKHALSSYVNLCTCIYIKLNFPTLGSMKVRILHCNHLFIFQIMGCCNKVGSSQLVRPGVKIPFMSICEAHRKRLKLHQCCPGCGHFCTQVSIYICEAHRKRLKLHQCCPGWYMIYINLKITHTQHHQHKKRNIIHLCKLYLYKNKMPEEALDYLQLWTFPILNKYFCDLDKKKKHWLSQTCGNLWTLRVLNTLKTMVFICL